MVTDLPAAGAAPAPAAPPAAAAGAATAPPAGTEANLERPGKRNMLFSSQLQCIKLFRLGSYIACTLHVHYCVATALIYL